MHHRPSLVGGADLNKAYMNGWIKLHRELLEKPIWALSTPEQKVILITLLLMVNHEGRKWEFGGKIFNVEPGQVVTSLETIVGKAGNGISTRNVRTALKRFENHGFLTNQSTNRNRLITICNWESYQLEDYTADKLSDKQTTSRRQADDKQVTTNKNDKNVKNDKKSSVKEKSTRFIPPTVEEIEEYCSKRENNINANQFFDFYEAKGWMVGRNKMKDWKAAVRTWERRGSGSSSTYVHPATSHKTSKAVNDDRW